MELFIPYGYTPYEGNIHYGVFNTREQAEAVLSEERSYNYYESYEIFVTKLNIKDLF
jgi:hypothetical protein